MNMDDICNYVFDNSAQILGALNRQAQQACDSDGCLETDTPTTQVNPAGGSSNGNIFVIFMGMMLLYFLLNLLGRRSRANLTEKVRNNTNNRERDTIF